jgi:uncharacterized UBP type Zn finger protein
MWVFQRQNCNHIDQIREDVVPSAQGCEDCLRTGDTWVHLRECLICGHVGCCDSSKNKHAHRHADEAGHPIVRSFEPGQDWRWCFVDEVQV